jgi:hypothetical protein
MGQGHPTPATAEYVATHHSFLWINWWPTLFDNFYLWPDRITLWRDPDSVQEFIDEVTAERIQPTLVVLDPLGTCLGGADENDNGHMRQVLNSAEDISRELHTAVLLVYHTPTSGTEKARGAQALSDGVSMQGYFTSIGDPLTRGVLQCKKQKDDERFEPISRAIHKVSIGADKTSLAFCDEHKTGPRDQTQDRVGWNEIRQWMATEDIVTPAMVSKVFKISPKAAYNHLSRNARSVGEGGYILPDVDGKAA